MNTGKSCRFTVEDSRGIRRLCRTMGAVLLLVGTWVLLSVCGVLSAWLTEDDRTLFALLGPAALMFGAYMLGVARRSITADGEELCCQPAFGKCRCFRFADIARVRFTGSGYRLIGRDGKTLARFEIDQKNSEILLRSLREHDL